MASISAVDWYAKEHLKLLVQLENKELTLGEYVVKHQDILQKAKSIEDLTSLKKRNTELQDQVLLNDTTKKPMSKNNMTAVEWLWELCEKKGGFNSKDLEQAKQMEAEQNKVTEDTSDGYHTFKELYHFRMIYNAALFNEWYRTISYSVHKSKRHNDGELCLGGGWFIVVAMLPTGMISNHYELQHWDLFNIPSVEKAAFPFDGHTSKDVIDRLTDLLKSSHREQV